MKLSYLSEKYKFWTQSGSVTFNRKLENETAFDGIIKIYSLSTDIKPLNDILKNKFFGDFIFTTERGIFLRMFSSKTSWPVTSLVHLNLDNYELIKIHKTRSSWANWKVNITEAKKYAIEISPDKVVEYETQKHLTHNPISNSLLTKLFLSLLRK